MRRILAVFLVLALLVSPALAATADLFPAQNAYAGFADVAAGTWYADAVRTCYEVGLMNGTGGESFTPQGTMTVAEAATIAARIRATITGEPIPSATPLAGETRAWYDDYVGYLRANGVSVSDPGATATRAQFFGLLSAVVPAQELSAINAITTLPDTEDPAVLRFYNAGILTGTDSYGTFNPSGTLSRAECAAMVARIVRPGLRVSFTPQEKPQEPQLSYEEELNATTAMLVNGKAVTLGQFATTMSRLVYNADYNLLVQTGARLDWNGDYGVGDLDEFFIDQTTSYFARQMVMEQQAAALGCQVDDLARTLNPNPSQEVLSAYAQGLDYLAAKHILIQTVDPSTGTTTRSDEAAQDLANQIIEALNASSTMQQFENLMAMFNDDPGMTAYPEGYLFTAGEMVSEFENAVRGLSVGGYTAEPVKSAYGYHVILRLDPAELTELKEAYQEQVLSAMVNAWVESSTITLNRAMLEQLNVQGTYQAYLQALAAQG